jgi:hypothetical protein
MDIFSKHHDEHEVMKKLKELDELVLRVLHLEQRILALLQSLSDREVKSFNIVQE